MSPGILEPVLHSSWQVQWWSEFNGVGKRNSDEGLKTPHSQYNLQVSLMASSHQRAWGCRSNVCRVQPCSIRTRTVCFPFWWWFNPLRYRLPCPLLLTSAAIVTVCFQQREGEEKPLWAFGSVQERLTAGVKGWTRAPAVSMCCQQSWPDSRCTSCALHDGSKEMEGTFWKRRIPAALLPADTGDAVAAWAIHHRSGSHLAASFQVIPGKGNSFGWMSKGNTRRIPVWGCTA